MPHTAVYDGHYRHVARTLNGLKKYRVTPGEAALILSFVINFLVAKLLHLFSQEEEVYNYYNNKGNIFNQWFVKRGWGWTTLVMVVYYAFQHKKLQNRPTALAYAVARYIAATFWWILFTQWCFGLPIMDRVFLGTGGRCAAIQPGTTGVATGNVFYQVEEAFESRLISSMACRQLKGSWVGGHDPLGHVFLLVHASLYMFQEIAPHWLGWFSAWNQAKLVVSSQHVGVGGKCRAVLNTVPQLPAVALLCLWWYMLLMTNMYFHSLAEKLVGLAFGYVGIAAVYYLPRFIFRQSQTPS